MEQRVTILFDDLSDKVIDEMPAPMREPLKRIQAYRHENGLPVRDLRIVGLLESGRRPQYWIGGEDELGSSKGLHVAQDPGSDRLYDWLGAQATGEWRFYPDLVASVTSYFSKDRSAHQD